MDFIQPGCINTLREYMQPGCIKTDRRTNVLIFLYLCRDENKQSEKTMETNDLADSLELKGLKPTANRILVLKALKEQACPVSLTDLEDILATMDKSSIFRVLTLFLEHDIVHSFEDGRGILNYELCTSKTVCNLSDAHIHFYCESCRKSFCMDDIPLPEFELKPGFTMRSVSFVIKGECPECGRKHKNI